MGRYDSKRVLHVGRGGSTAINIDVLKGNGAYVIVADNCPVEENRYINLADEVIQLDIDNSDIVINYCKENNIDAIVTNWEEESYEKARVYNESIGNKFYHTAQQWQTFMNKDVFRNLCNQYNIDTPKTFYTGSLSGLNNEIKSSFKYPLIIKPTDNGGANGISVCKRKYQLNKALIKANKYSHSKNIIVEEYIEGKEVAFTYVIQNGITRLVNSSDKYVYKDRNNITATPELYIYPCSNHDLYVNNINKKVISMIESQHLDNCTVFFQAIEKDNIFYIFEAGLRCEGTGSFYINRKYTHQDANDFFFDYLLKVKTNYDVTLDDPKYYGHEGALYTIHLRKGRIKKIDGLSCIKESKVPCFATVIRHVGQKIYNTPMGRLFAGIVIFYDNKEELVETIRKFKHTIKVKDVLNRNMIVDSFDESIILKQK